MVFSKKRSGSLSNRQVAWQTQYYMKTASFDHSCQFVYIDNKILIRITFFYDVYSKTGVERIVKQTANMRFATKSSVL